MLQANLEPGKNELRGGSNDRFRGHENNSCFLLPRSKRFHIFASVYYYIMTFVVCPILIAIAMVVYFGLVLATGGVNRALIMKLVRRRRG